MKQVKIVDVINASKPLKELMNVRFASFKTTHDLVSLSKYIDSELEFYIQENKKLQSIYSITPETKDQESINKYNEDLAALLKTEVEFNEALMVTIKETDMVDKSHYPTPLEMITLESFVRFE